MPKGIYQRTRNITRNIPPKMRETYYNFVDDRVDGELPRTDDCNPLGPGLFEHRWNRRRYMCNFPDPLPDEYFFSQYNSFSFPDHSQLRPSLSWEWPTKFLPRPSKKKADSKNVVKEAQEVIKAELTPNQQKVFALELLEQTDPAAFMRFAYGYLAKHEPNIDKQYAETYLRAHIEQWKK